MGCRSPWHAFANRTKANWSLMNQYGGTLQGVRLKGGAVGGTNRNSLLSFFVSHRIKLLFLHFDLIFEKFFLWLRQCLSVTAAPSIQPVFFAPTYTFVSIYVIRTIIYVTTNSPIKCVRRLHNYFLIRIWWFGSKRQTIIKDIQMWHISIILIR